MDYSNRLLLSMLLPATALTVQAQVTTSAVGGQVTNDEGEPLMGVAVKAIHGPSGTIYKAVTNKNGRYTIQGMRPGGPYTLDFSYIGYATQHYEKLYADLGNTLQVDAKMQERSSELSTAVVTANRKTVAGAGENFNLSKIETTPTIDRSVYDIVKNSPMVMTSKLGGISFVGTNNRYNSFQIDGVVANDVFGLSSGGTNGAQTGANPVSMDAIEEIQVVVAPYDVRQGGFTGGGINAVTKSGTNQFHGSAYSYFYNQKMFGKYSVAKDYQRSPMESQHDRTFGATLGGPILKDKLFFFASIDHKSHQHPNEFYPGYRTGYITPDIAETIAQEYEKYTGKTAAYNKRDLNEKSLGILGRLDWNVNPAHHISLRYQYNNSYKDSYGAGNSTYVFSNSGFRYNNLTNSLVAEWSGQLNEFWHNQLRASMTFVRDKRQVPYQGPTVQIDNVMTGTSRSIGARLGTEFSSGANRLNQDTYTIEDNLNFYQGNHTLTIGTHNEFYKISNLFIQAVNGSWNFKTLDDFMQDKPYQFTYNYTDPAMTGGNLQYTPAMKAGQFGLYVQDKWNVNRHFNWTLGLRLDIPTMFNHPSENPTFNAYARENHLGVKVGTMPSTKVMVSPRLGFNLYLTEDHSSLLRGGTGIFTGRVPFVWLSNAFNANGVEKKSTTLRGDKAPHLNQYQNQLDQVAANATNTGKPDIAVVAKKFKYPQVFRSNLAFEQKLPGDIKMTLEAIYSKTLNNVFFENMAIHEIAKVYAVPGVENSAAPYYNIEQSDYNSIINLKNTNKGYSYALSALLEKHFNNGLDIAASYTFGHSKSVNDGTSSVAFSNWKYNYSRDTNGKGELGYSKFDIPHRIMVRVNWTSPRYANGWTGTQVGVVYNANSGERYSLNMFESEDFNGDGQRGNNLLYIPTKEELSQMHFTNQGGKDADQNRAAFEKWIEQDNYAKDHRGSYAPRNSNSLDWEHSVDLHLGQTLYLKNACSLEFTMDVINFTNCLNKRWGAQYGRIYSYSPLKVVSMQQMEDGNYTPVYAFNEQSLYKSDFQSRWHMQLGVKLKF